MRGDRRKSRPRQGDPIPVSDAYLRAIEKLESLPQNQSGADKTWVERAIRSFREHYAKAVRVR